MSPVSASVLRALAPLTSRGGAERKTSADAYENMLACPARGSSVYLLSHEGSPCGFSLFESNGSGVGCYANLCLGAGFPGLSEAGLYAVLENLHENGISHVNLGGSERKSLHRYKLKCGDEQPPASAALVARPCTVSTRRGAHRDP